MSAAESVQGDSLHPRELAAWAVLRTVPDPEIPVLGLCDLGIVREVQPLEPTLRVVLTPTYSGCPATEVIAQSVVNALDAAGLGPTQVVQRHAPAWTTDWITPEGRRKLREYGIAPPGACASAEAVSGTTVLRLRPRNVECPRCGSLETERLAAFVSTACTALHRCSACRVPFAHFKPI